MITSLGDVVIWKAADCGAKRITGNEIVHITENFFTELKQQNIKVNGLITDLASENTAARLVNFYFI